MAYDLSPEAEAAALKARKADLRAFAEDIAERVARMPMPETYLEAERGARAVWVADRVLVRVRQEMLGDGDLPPPSSVAQGDVCPWLAEAILPQAPNPLYAGEEGDCPAPSEVEAEGEGWSMPYLMTPVRLRLRTYADRLMECAALLDKPTCYLEGERAARYALAADRMLEQLYAPKVAKVAGRAAAGGDNNYDGMDGLSGQPARDDYDAWYALLEGKLNLLARNHASHAGYWPNGAPYVEGEPEPEEATPFNGLDCLGDLTEYSPAKDAEIRIKGRAWYAETHNRDSEMSEAEKAELIARIEADWNAGRLQREFPLRSASWGSENYSPPLRSGGGGIERSEMTEGAAVGGMPPPSAAPPPPPLRRGGEESGPSVRIVESIFAPSGPFGKRPCGCAISAPKCKGPCPIPP